MPDAPQRPDADDTTAAFAADLRTLRHDAGNPTLGQIERESGVSKSVVSDALAGRKLPSARTVRGVVAACGGDAAVVGEWVARRDALASATSRDPEPDDQAAQEQADTPRGARVVRLSTALVAAAAALVVGVGGTLAVVTGLSAGSASADSEPTPTAMYAPQISVKVGADPADTKCLDDAVVAASETGSRGTQLQIIYSTACHAAWSRITRFDNEATGNEVSTSIFRVIAPHAKDRQSTTEPDAQSAYTTLLVRPTPDTEICATGSITVKGQTIAVGKEVCL
ncbi:helix-turn-helix domain-containing protein [Frondihabitans australicus]|uniref:Uncharacterized protein DUF2690 n=1 Tax=Frondihabitans australicus TaxID=386892 RepID=A0A495IC09_9MICO|nr:XRE family transcriptional regulator [Frondihabitans australicus]RKR73534.1 uncharacterized protein DUF2690 [Frondihabitans australicus]